MREVGLAMMSQPWMLLVLARTGSHGLNLSGRKVTFEKVDREMGDYAAS
jgi:hypothetical protein